MVKFQIASDLHLETSDVTPCAKTLINPVADILILAGDIGRVLKLEQLKSFLKDVCQYFQHVIYVLGNHEYYKISPKNPIFEKTMEEIYSDVMCIAKEIPNLVILNRSSILIDNICIIGCTLWSKPMISVPPYIVKVKNMNTSLYSNLHKQDLRYIERMIAYCKEKEYKLVVVTHHAPSYCLLSHSKDGDLYRSLYASNLDHLLDKNNIDTWIYGHTHYNIDIHFPRGTRVVSNQRGKPKDNILDFSREKIIELN